MDFTKLRAAALKDGDDEEAVTVNTRALIDKVLARYSGEWTTLRELIQNAADAQATTVTIKFETLPSPSVPVPSSPSRSQGLKHVLLHHTLQRLLVTNNGDVFGKEDWNRLKRIAEGNPNMDKIGAFGVGFYSVFADCEEPFVSSGKEAMAFYWKGNSLFTRTLQLSADQASPNTSFCLDYRNTTTPMPSLLSICQFLATSLTFVALQGVELWIDDWNILKLQKKASPGARVPIPRDFETRTTEGLMQVASLERESVQMDATFMNVVGWKPLITSNLSVSYGGYGSNAVEAPSLRSFFSKLAAPSGQAQFKAKAAREEQALQEKLLEDLTAPSTANVFLRVTTATIQTSIHPAFAKELERATKKPPPKMTKLAILTSSYDETVASTVAKAEIKAADVFASVLPGKKPGGRIFIGFPTHQTTGAGIHLSAPAVIPTVERESIDLNAAKVKTWNVEMLRAAGIVSRLSFVSEMADLSLKVKRAAETAGHGKKITKTEVAQFIPEALHILNTFTFTTSTPSTRVGEYIEEAFWRAYKKPSIELYSTRGVLPSTIVRITTEDLSGFVDGIPVVPDELMDTAFIRKLQEADLIEGITIGDVKKELEVKALTADQVVQFIAWAGRKALNEDIDVPTIHSLLDVAVATVEEGGHGGVVALGSIKSYLNVSKVPPEMPIPPTTLPFELARASTVPELNALQWHPLEIVPWLRFVIESKGSLPAQQNLTANSLFAAQVLQVLSKAWDDLDHGSKAAVTQMLENLPIIPTKLGMRKPKEAFFGGVRLFDDLPNITACPGVKEKFLAAIGVRKTLDLETIFSRWLAAPQAQPDGRRVHSRHVEVIKYLASVRDDIPFDDLEKLKRSQICPAEAGPRGMESTQPSARLYRISELFEPKSDIRELGLPIIQWPGPPGSFRHDSSEGRFLSLLGLRAFPSAEELIDLMASNDAALRRKAMAYFITNHHHNGYFAFSMMGSQKSFLPIEGNADKLVRPTECFTRENCAVLGFNILNKDLQAHATKFGVATDPPITDCIDRLIAKPPRSKQDATQLYCYFAGRLLELKIAYTARLANSRIVPVTSRSSSLNSSVITNGTADKAPNLLTPTQVYLGSSATFEGIFEFVDFGNDANAFLMKCGSKQEPTKLEIAAITCKEPARILGQLQSPEKYLSLLRTMAEDLPTIRRDTALFQQMKKSAFLLGQAEIAAIKPIRKSGKEGLDSDDDIDQDDLDEAPLMEYKLALPTSITVIDDYVSYRKFKSSLNFAPQEDLLEHFYKALGSPTLSSLVKEDLRLGPAIGNQDIAEEVRAHVLERAKLFLHEYAPQGIHHDARWLEKNLSVKVVSSISLRRSLRGHTVSHTEKRSAAVTEAKGMSSTLTLYITSKKYDTYQISQGLCRYLVIKHNAQAAMTFETFLSLSLYELRNRGYNVNRILQAKQQQQRIAEQDRQKQMEIEQQKLQEEAAKWQASGGQEIPANREEHRQSTHVDIPGAFGSDPAGESPPPSPKRRGRGFFSGLTRRFGINSGGGDEFKNEASNEAENKTDEKNGGVDPTLQEFLGMGGSTRKNPFLNGKAGGKTLSPPGTSNGTGKGNTERVTSPADVQSNLLKAIQSSRGHDSSTLFSPPSAKAIKEQSSYCDSTPATNITFLADTSNGVRIFVDKTLKATTPSVFLSQNVTALNTFASLLYDIADIYGLQRDAIQIFYDEVGSTIAFNFNGSYFCNFRFFAQLHEEKMLRGASEQGRVDATSYWWVVLAHELAHNLVKPHDAEHSYYTEMFVANYFSKMMAKGNSYLTQGSGASGLGSGSGAGPSSSKQLTAKVQSLLE